MLPHHTSGEAIFTDVVSSPWSPSSDVVPGTTRPLGEHTRARVQEERDRWLGPAGHSFLSLEELPGGNTAGRQENVQTREKPQGNEDAGGAAGPPSPPPPSAAGASAVPVQGGRALKGTVVSNYRGADGCCTPSGVIPGTRLTASLRRK